MEYIGLQAFEGTKHIKDLMFYEYEMSWNIDDTRKNKILGGFKNKLKLTNGFKFIFYKENSIYSKEKLILPQNVEYFKIKYLGVRRLEVSEFLNLYSSFITYCINDKLRTFKDENSETKYEVSYTNEILTKNIFTQSGKEIKVKSSDNSRDKIELFRKFYIYPKVEDSGEVMLYVSCSSEFNSLNSIYDLLRGKRDVTNIYVKNKWNNIKGVGKITEVSKLKINDNIKGFEKKGNSLVGYQKYINCGYRVKDFTYDDLNSNCVKVKFLGSDLEYLFIPHSLKPIITWEYIKKEHKEFGEKILKYVKMNMEYRIKTILNLINDIGAMESLDNLGFDSTQYKMCTSVGYTTGQIQKPKYTNGEVELRKKDSVFQVGFYDAPKDIELFSILYPKGHLKEAKIAIRAIYDFLLNYNTCYNKGYNISKNLKSTKLLNIEMDKYKYKFIEYDTNEKSEFLNLAKKIKDDTKVKLAIVLIDDKTLNCGDDGTYFSLKKALLRYNIQSQMIEVGTASKLNKENKNSIYFLKNICLGILGKLGGVPWVLKNIEHKYDCFIGLDVASINTKVHFTACSFVFGENYDKIYTFKPTSCQIGEKIPTNILKQIFDNVLSKYKDEYKVLPENIVIHRDGFCREDITWIQKYFNTKNIKFNIIEIKKNSFMRFFEFKENKILNPKEGRYILKEDTAYIVTTNVLENLGAPMPLKIHKVYGEISMMEVLRQIYYLAKIHVGSTFSTRLPITTEYADKTCKSIQYVLSGEAYDKLFFL